MRQLEFNLTPRAEHHGSIEPWAYRFEKGTLLEEINSRRYVYGLWDNFFGCWEIDTETNTSREIIPTWEPLNSTGVWRDHLEIRFENVPSITWLLSPKWRYEANAAFAGLFSSIPQRIRSVVASCKHYQWLVLDMIWQVPDFAYFLDDEIYNGTQQYIFACLALSEAKSLSRSERRELAISIMNSKRHELLSSLTPAPSSKRTVRLLNKLGRHPCNSDTYQGLIKFTHIEPSSKILNHISQIEPMAVSLLTWFPKDFLTKKFLRILFEETDDCHLLAVIDDYEPGSGFRTVVDIFPILSQSWKVRIRTSLNTVSNFSGLPEWGERWARTLTELIHFPAPPFQAIDSLIPLASPKAIRQEAQVMQNCISRMIASILTGNSYFYSWDQLEAATVLFTCASGDEWEISEIHGYNNNKVSTETKTEIERVAKMAFSRKVRTL